MTEKSRRGEPAGAPAGGAAGLTRRSLRVIAVALAAFGVYRAAIAEYNMLARVGIALAEQLSREIGARP